MKTTPRTRYLLKRFGITEQQYDELLLKQNGRCAICKRPAAEFKIKLAVEHDHRSGHIRGLACTYCNRYIIGRYRRETAELLKSAYEYLTGEYPGWIVPPKVKKKYKRKKRK